MIYTSIPKKKIQSLKPKGVKNIATMILGALEGLHHMHECGFVHRNMKLDNIFVTMDDTPKVGDFGISKEKNTEIQGLTFAEFQESYSDQTDTGRCGTSIYMPPEITQGRYKATPAQDTYSLGMTALITMFGGVEARVTGTHSSFEFHMIDNLESELDGWLEDPVFSEGVEKDK